MRFPAFDTSVPVDGYRWWYLDAVSDDGKHAITLIAFVGSVFSPYYAHARARRRGEPSDHCAVNIAVYGPGARWAMTERGRARLARSSERLAVGPSQLTWDGHALTAELAEVAAPLPRRVRGRVRAVPTALTGAGFALDGDRRHWWLPVAPTATVEVELDEPSLHWRGAGYIDANAGDEPLEAGFVRWDWSRADLGGDAGAVVVYDPEPRRGSAETLALRFDPDGKTHTLHAPPLTHLPRTGWRVDRRTRADEARAAVVETLEDTPFYARSLVRQHLAGRDVLAVHESLSLERFRAPWVRLLLPFRMPRRAG